MAASKILITDDDVDTCEILSDIFRERGYGVVTAGTGSEAVDKAGQTTFDVALIDIRLPDMEGLELIAALKGMQADMVVVMITGYASCRNCGASPERRGIGLHPQALEHG